MEKIIKLNQPGYKSINKNIFNGLLSGVKDKVASIVFASALFLSTVNASDNLGEDYHDLLNGVENALKGIGILDEDQKYRAQLYYLYESIKNDSIGFKFRSDNDLLKGEFSKNSTGVGFIDKNDIYKSEELEVFLKYGISYYEKEENKKVNYGVSTGINLKDFDMKLEAGVFNSKLSDFSKDKKVIYSEIVKNFYPENFPKIKVTGAVSNYDGENYYNGGIRTYNGDNLAFESLYDSSKINNGTSIGFQVFLKFYKSGPEVHTKVYYKNGTGTFKIINQGNVINQPDDTRLFFENNLAGF